MGNLALSNSFFLVLYLLVSLSSRRRFLSWMRHTVHDLHFVPRPCMVVFGGAGAEGIFSESACASPIFIFPLGRLKSSHPSPSPLRLSYFQIPSAYKLNHKTLRIDRTSGLEISCLLCGLAYAFHSHQHTKQLCISQPLADSIPCFSGLRASWA